MRETVVTSVIAFIAAAVGAMISAAPTWVPLAIAISGSTILLVIALLYLPEIRLRLRQGTPVEHHIATDWHEFDELPLKYAACMWVGRPPTSESLRDHRVQEELARLSLAVRQRKLEHPLGDLFYFMSLISARVLSVANDQFSKVALVQYAQNTNRPIPDFLKPTLEKLKTNPPVPKPETSSDNESGGEAMSHAEDEAT